MKWTRKKSKSTLSAVTGDSTTYTIYLLTVESGEDSDRAITDFWRVVFEQATALAGKDWDTLRIEFCAEAGVITAIFCSRKKANEEVIVVKIALSHLASEYAEIEDWEQPIRSMLAKIKKLELGYQKRLTKAAAADENKPLLSSLKKAHRFQTIFVSTSSPDIETVLKI